MTNGRSWVDAEQRLAVPGYVLLFLMSAFPIAQDLIYVKYGLFTLLLVIIELASLQRRRFNLHPQIAIMTLFMALLGLFFGIKGVEYQISPRILLVYALFPLIYAVVITGISSQGVLIGIQRVLVLATLFIAVYGLTYILVNLGILPSVFFVRIFDQGEAIAFHSGYVGSNLYSFNSLPFLIPFLMTLLVMDYSTENKPPVPRVLVFASLVLTLALILVSGRRALVLLFPFSFLLLYFFRFFQLPGERYLSSRAIIGMAVGGILCVWGLSYYYWNQISDFDLMRVFDQVLSGFGWGSAESDIGYYIRNTQYTSLMSAWAENPLLGAGLNAYVPGLIRDWASPWAYELYYVALLYQVGLLGFISYAAGIIWIYWMGIRIVKEGGSFGHVMLPFLVGLSGVLLVGATNPILPRFDGIWAIFLPIGVINFWLLEQRKKDEMHSNDIKTSLPRIVAGSRRELT